MPRPKSKKNMYFDQNVQDAIVVYNSLDREKDQEKRSKVYQNEIHAAFMKLAENIINTFKFSYFDYGFVDIQHEVVAFMVMNIHKYDHTKGSKAFSYFSIVAKNYLILHNNANYKKYKTHDPITTAYKNQRTGALDDGDFKELLDEVILYFEENILNIFKRKRDIDIAYAVLELMKRNDEIENHNKKALYILIREMTNVHTTHITNVINKFKKHYKKFLNEQHGANKIPHHNRINKFF